ncbi:MAG TPA: hypothetical protein PKG77_19470 [Phycisphaerae bacterium]|nr:hypothetical protein [Phycisphaerae bacterium]
MSDKGPNILKAIRQVRTLHGQVALLLQTAESMIKKSGWTPAWGNNAVSGSNSILAPDWWAPIAASRFFHVAEYPNLLAFISVLLDDVEEQNRLQEPLVTCGWIDYGKGTTAGGNFFWWYCRAHLFQADHVEDGSIFSGARQQLYPKSNYPIKRISTFALPLASINSSDDLQAKVIDVLLKQTESVWQFEQVDPI